MKRSLLLLPLMLLSFNSVFAQEETENDTIGDSYNKWSIEANFGQGKGIKPYAQGYFYSNPNKHIAIDINHFDVGARYMISPKFGLKLDFAYDKFENQSGSESLPFEMQQYRVGIQGVVNAVRLFNIEEAAGRLGLLFHGGFQASQMTPQMGANDGKTEYNGGIMLGFTPQFRITNNLALAADFSVLSNVRQHFNWDGSFSESSNNLAGSMYSVTLGLSYSFGREKIHGDWAVIEEKRAKELDELDKRVGELETMMNDADKDGVPDYLDTENNSIAGVAVDTKGRMVDLNRNGIPDELEKYVDKSVTTGVQKGNEANNSEIIKKLINEGYIAVFFDFGSYKPTPSSTENVAFILNYLRNNPSASADITGYADEIGGSATNKALSEKRANYIKETLVRAGINASRLNIVPAGEDNSVDKNSAMARRLVRKAIFTIK